MNKASKSVVSSAVRTLFSLFSFCSHLSLADGLIPSFNPQTTYFIGQAIYLWKKRKLSPLRQKYKLIRNNSCFTYERFTSSNYFAKRDTCERIVSLGTLFKVKTLSVSWRPYRREMKTYTRTFYCRHLSPNSFSWIQSFLSRPPSKMARTRWRTHFVWAASGYLTLNTTSHQSQLPRILYKLKDSVNALTKLNNMTLSLHFHFNLSCECEDWLRIGNRIRIGLRLNCNFIVTTFFISCLNVLQYYFILIHADTN